MNIKASPTGLSCIKVTANLTKGVYTFNDDVEVTLTELNKRNATREFMVRMS